jgi:hypothetical protein
MLVPSPCSHDRSGPRPPGRRDCPGLKLFMPSIGSCIYLSSRLTAAIRRLVVSPFTLQRSPVGIDARVRPAPSPRP